MSSSPSWSKKTFLCPFMYYYSPLCSAWTNSRVTLSLTARFILSSQRMNKFKRLIFISLGEMTNYFFLQDMALECKLHMVSHYHKDYFKAHDISSSQHIDGLSKLKFFSRQNIEMLHDQHSLVGNHLLSLIFLWKFGINFGFEIMAYPFPVFIFERKICLKDPTSTDSTKSNFSICPWTSSIAISSSSLTIIILILLKS